MPQNIDLTPTWAGLLPAMLDAYANMKRQLGADDICDGYDDGWCTVHDSSQHAEYEGVVARGPAARCLIAQDRDALFAWRTAVLKALGDLTIEFTRMADAADRYNAERRAEG